MTYFKKIETTSLTIGNEKPDGSFEPVVALSLSGNNDTPQRSGRLHIGWEKDYSAEIEIEPGPNCHPVGNIVSQVMLWGPKTKDGTGRKRLTTSIVTDVDGGLAGVIDSSTNDPSGSAGQQSAMPLVLNAGEGRGIYVVLYPSDGTIAIQDRVNEVSVRLPASDAIRRLSRPERT